MHTITHPITASHPITHPITHASHPITASSHPIIPSHYLHYLQSIVFAASVLVRNLRLRLRCSAVALEISRTGEPLLVGLHAGIMSRVTDSSVLSSRRRRQYRPASYSQPVWEQLEVRHM